MVAETKAVPEPSKMSREMKKEYNLLYQAHLGAKNQKIDWLEKLTSDLMSEMTEWAKAERPLFKPEGEQ